MPEIQLIGISLKQCKASLGDITRIQLFRERTEEIVFDLEDVSIRVVLLDDKVHFALIWMATMPNNILDALRIYSGREDWIEEKSRNPDITGEFRYHVPDEPSHTIYSTSDGSLFALSSVSANSSPYTLEPPYALELVVSGFEEMVSAMPHRWSCVINEKPHAPYFFYKDCRYSAKVGQIGSHDHFFGRSENLTILESCLGRAIHQLITFDISDPDLGLSMEGLAYLPLLYCFQFNSGVLEYELVGENQVRITRLDTSFEEWPYRHYPKRFDKLPFSIEDEGACTFEDFAGNLWQGIKEREKDKFICVVPPSCAFSAHLWEEDSDSTDINIVFLVDVKNRKVRVYNECD